MGTKHPIAIRGYGAGVVTYLGDELIMRWRPCPVSIRVVSSLSLIVWAVCFQHIVRSSDPIKLLLIPLLWALWLLLACAAVWAFLGIESLRVGPSGLKYSRRAIIEFTSLQIPLEQVRGIADDAWLLGESRTAVGDLKFETDVGSVRFAQGVETKERHRLATLFWEHLRGLHPHQAFSLEIADRNNADDFTVDHFSESVARWDAGGTAIVLSIDTTTDRVIPSEREPLWDPELDGLPMAPQKVSGG